MENERMKRYPHINVNALKSLYPQENSDSKLNKRGARKNGKKQKRKLSKAQQQSMLVSGICIDDVGDADPGSEKSDGELAVLTDFSATDIDDVVDIDEEEKEANESELMVYPQPCDIISWKKLSKDSVLIGLPYDAAFFFKGCLQVSVSDLSDLGFFQELFFKMTTVIWIDL
jgi:hypothetical protein